MLISVEDESRSSFFELTRTTYPELTSWLEEKHNQAEILVSLAGQQMEGMKTKKIF